MQLTVEVLLVADESVYNDHKRFTGSADQSTVFNSMRAYFSHMMNGVGLEKKI